MPYEYTVTSGFTVPRGRTYAIGDKITDESVADDIHAKHLGRNICRHEVTTPPAPEEAPAEASAEPVEDDVSDQGATAVQSLKSGLWTPSKPVAAN